MSWPADRSPTPKSNNSPDWSQCHYGNFRSPFPSPRNGHDFGGQSPMKNFGWRNNTGYPRFQKDRFHYSPGGNRRGRGGNFRSRGGGHFRGSPADGADISLYVNPSMLSDPWKELEETLGTNVTPGMSRKRKPAVASTPNSSISTSRNTSVSNSDTKENMTQESVVISDDSSDDILLSDQTVPGDDNGSPKANVQTPEPPSAR